jgi:hypothetical protein
MPGGGNLERGRPRIGRLPEAIEGASSPLSITSSRRGLAVPASARAPAVVAPGDDRAVAPGVDSRSAPEPHLRVQVANSEHCSSYESVIPQKSHDFNGFAKGLLRSCFSATPTGTGGRVGHGCIALGLPD